MSVGYYTGIPEISVPLYEINTGKLKLPISLSYHASGIKVEEIASWVGLGWSLNIGGAITRQTRGRPDEASNGFLEKYPDITRYLNNQMSDGEKDAYQKEAIAGNIDTQPDLFFYNTPRGAWSFSMPLRTDYYYNANPRINWQNGSAIITRDPKTKWPISISDLDGHTYQIVN